MSGCALFALHAQNDTHNLPEFLKAGGSLCKAALQGSFAWDRPACGTTRIMLIKRPSFTSLSGS